MRTKIKFIFAVLITCLLSSCATPFYQLYQVKPISNIETKGNFLVYEDENCIVSYNLWSEGGNMGFKFYNKTDTNIFLNLEESFFILNGIAHDYYKNRVFTNSTSSGLTVSSSKATSKSVTGVNYLDLLQTNIIQVNTGSGLATSSGYSVSYNEEKIICIPSKSSKIITEYSINDLLYRDCELFRYPTKRQINPKTFSKATSPLVFSNRIAYTVEGLYNLSKFDNEFYVSEISNYPAAEFIESRPEVFCGQKSSTPTNFFKSTAPNKFYIRYNKGSDTWKH